MFWRSSLAQILFLSIVLLLALPGVAEESARVEGVLFIDGKPAHGTVFLKYAHTTGLDSTPFLVESNEEGKFVFESVKPVEARIGREIDTYKVKASGRAPDFTQSHTRTIFPKPGETLKVDVGDGGWSLKGKMVAPEDTEVTVDWQGGFTRRLMTAPEPPPVPQGLSREEQQTWWKEFQDSEDGRAIRAKQREYLVEVDKDGAFRVADIAPGTYHLYIEVADANDGPRSASVGQFAQQVEFPEGEEPGVKDLGEVEPKIYNYLEVGETAPPFEVELLDGETLKLSDLQGKYVLLDFWATWCGPCIGEMPHMKEIYERFGDNPKFAMVALSLDQDREALETYVEKEGLKWTQAFLGNWSEATLPDTYGVRGIPEVFLIGPDGKIAEVNLRGDRTVEAVAKALGE